MIQLLNSFYSMRFDEKSGRFSDSPGVHISVPNFGDVSSVEFLDRGMFPVIKYYKDMVDFFVKTHGYERNVDIHAAPWDWRLLPGSYFWLHNV